MVNRSVKLIRGPTNRDLQKIKTNYNHKTKVMKN